MTVKDLLPKAMYVRSELQAVEFSVLYAVVFFLLLFFVVCFFINFMLFARRFLG